jgi:ATP/maltotriose-dependent transcriptional regulator MalT/DNA-binding SARP family transcriptional activator
MVAMRVRDDGAVHRLPRIDVEAAGGAEESPVGRFDEHSRPRCSHAGFDPGPIAAVSFVGKIAAGEHGVAARGGRATEARMSKASAPPSLNVCPPRLVRVTPRARLFDRLDGLAGAAIWIYGAPGAGKTTLAATYARARRLRTVWYRLDADDNDAAKFFATVAEAAMRIGVRLRPPAFAPEDLRDLPAYARRFFRALFARLPEQAALVLDNAEQSGLESLPALLAAAVAELPAGRSLVVTSRELPPPALGADVLAGRLMLCGGEELRFDAEELRLYARDHGLALDAVEEAARRLDGWAAGLRLAANGADTMYAAASRRWLDDYLLALCETNATAERSRLLQASAMLPWIPAELAATLAGVPDALAHFEALRRGHLFTERIDAREPAFRFHPLLQAFLRERAVATWPTERLAALLREAAAWFEAHGHHDAAIGLALDAGDFASAARLVLHVYEARLAAGRLDQVDAWLARFPAEYAHAEPRLMYCRAREMFLREDPRALQTYRDAHAAFTSRGDRYWQQLCAAGILEWSYNSDSFLDHRRWCESFAAPLPDARVPDCEQHRVRLQNGRFLACFFAGDFAALADADIDRALHSLEPGECEGEKLSSAISLLGCLERAKRWTAALLLADRMQALLRAPSVSPRLAILARQQIASDLHRQTGRYAEATALATEALASAREHRFPILEYETLGILSLCALYRGDEPDARRRIAELDGVSRPGDVYHQRFACLMHAWLELQHGSLQRARECVAQLRAAVERSDMPPRFRATWLLLSPLLAFREGHERQAVAELRELAADAEAGSRETLEVNAGALEALAAFRCGHAEDGQRLAQAAFARAAALSFYQLLGPLRGELAELAAHVFAHRPADAFAVELVARRALAPPPSAAAAWPWRVRVDTLGHFALWIDGKRVTFAGKSPRKPIAVLKALIALGGRNVPMHRLADALWPDQPADAAREALHVALHRLRRLLGDPEALRLHEERLGLDPSRCTVDAWALEELLAAPASRHRALELYAGPFLADEDDAAWAIPMRERLRTRFVSAAVAAAEEAEHAGRMEEALACYRRGLEADELVEEFHRGLMRCALALGRPADGIAAYRRLKRLLSVVMGIAPSRETEALADALRQAPAPGA